VNIEDGTTGRHEGKHAERSPIAYDIWMQLAQTAELTHLLDVPKAHRAWMAAAFLLGAVACDALGGPDAVERAVERALDLAEAKAEAHTFTQPAPVLPDHQGRHRAASAALISQAVDLLARADRSALHNELTRPCEPLTQGEARVLRYLPSNLSAREIADELCVSMNTVRTHQRHLYRKLDARTRSQAVERARALGLLAPSSHLAPSFRKD
jgi:LuxR family transcriptional regulator, maltose regulon positive regulatory protein